MLKIIQKYKNMSLANRIIAAFASFFTVTALIALPVVAWFSTQRKLAELQSIKTPDLLYLSAACAEDVKYFDISSIDVGDTNSSEPAQQLYAFAVAGQYVSSFTLQFAHTTNNPFSYKIYDANLLTYTAMVDGKEKILPCTTEEQAKEAYIALNNPNPAWTEEEADAHFKEDVVVHEVNEQWDKIEMTLSQRTDLSGIENVYFIKDTCIKDADAEDYLNATVTSEGRLIATNKYHEDCYGEYEEFDAYAEPLYWQRSNIASVDDPTAWGAKPFFKTFILDVTWDRSKISNNKETDILYIAAFRS